MNIVATQYDINRKMLEIYIPGCDGLCNRINQQYIKDGIKEASCQNPELWDFEIGKYWENWKDEISEKLKSTMVECVGIFGGEPLLNDTFQLAELISWIKSHNKIIVYLFTRFEIGQVPKIILENCDFIKTGLFDYSFSTDNHKLLGFRLATSNQKIFKINGD